MMISGMFSEPDSLLEIETALWQVKVIKEQGTSQLGKQESPQADTFECGSF
jgi:hypothetical protein